MNILASIPVRLYGPESARFLIEDLSDKIAHRAHEIFLEHGQHGRDLDNWLAAERELIIKLDPTVTLEGQEVFIDAVLPTRVFENVAVHISPRQFVISSDENADGVRLFQVINLPLEMFSGTIDAEQSDSTVHISASILQELP